MEKFLVSLVLFLIIGGFIILEKYRKIKMVGNIYVKGYSLIEKKDRVRSFIYLIILILITLISIFLLDYYYILLLLLLLFLFNFIYPKNYYIGEQGISVPEYKKENLFKWKTAMGF